MSCCPPDTKKLEEVSEYYGKTVQTNKDLATNACCVADIKLSKKQKRILGQIHEEILSKFYGCGTPIPDLEEGLTVLDLGCGTGRDVYLASALVGQSGRSIGIDMTQEQLDVAVKHMDYQMKTFGFSKSNVEFKKGVIESLDIESDSVDVVISNCVINLSANKQKVFSEIHRVLKEGGELYFSDVFADRRIPKDLQDDKVLWGECLSGALYTEDFRRMLAQVGFADFRIVENVRLSVGNDEIQSRVGNIAFYSQTIRAFKLSLEDKCEDFGQQATYKGSIVDHPHAFVLDEGHLFVTDMSFPVCGNTADMLSQTRFKKHFEVTPRGAHRGLFGNCNNAAPSSSGGSCC